MLALTSHWIIKAGHKRHHHNYEDLCRDVLGPVGGYLHCTYTFFYSFTTCIAYVIITGQCLQDVSQAYGAKGIFADGRFYVVICAVFVMLPLSHLRNMVR